MMRGDELSERLLEFSIRIIRLCKYLNRDRDNRIISNQLLRSGTSIGANYEEARGAESRADFIHKLTISLKETRESLYWIKIIKNAGLIKSEKVEVIYNEANEICSILVSSVKTSKKSKI
ncbi:four helix bundle protein [bacterium]|nr:four helix bundle protein [bacterium]